MKKGFLSTIAYAGSLIVDQLLAVMASMLILNIFSFFSKGKAAFFQFLISVLIFAFIVYIDSWIRGSGDYNKIKLKIFKRNSAKGFIAGLIATIPAYIFAVFAYLAETKGIFFFDFMGTDFFTAMNRFWQLPLGNLYTYANNNPALNFLIPLFVPVVSGIGYIFGLNRISIKQIIIYKKDKE